MSRRTASTPIVNEQRFILATRDTGYRSTASAISELVDNAIQAGATIVRVFIDQSGVGVDRELSVAVLDNGCGMDKRTLETAMQFAGSSRFNDRTGLGRFGMGLPNSSVSQARRVDVYTWQDRDRVIYSYLDVDEIADGELQTVPRPRRAEMPDWASKYTRRRSGTLVEWSRCDRLDHRKATTIADKLMRPLGQRFRYFLWDGNKIYVNGQLVEPFDPLYLESNSGFGSASQFGDVLTVEFRAPSDPSATSTVRIRFSELPVAKWHDLSGDEKRLNGISKGAGVSVVRAGREIDFGWYFMGGKRKENYDDWWRCEVCFDPELDEMFGVTHSKQEINPSQLIRSELSQHLEGIAHSLNTRARAAFASVKVKEQKPSAAEAAAEQRESRLPQAGLRHAKLPAACQIGSTTETEQRPGQPLKFRLRIQPLNSPDLYLCDVSKNGTVLITVNSNHAFYEQVLRRAESKNDQTIRHGIECLFLAMARAELAVQSEDDTTVDSYKRAMSNALAAYLGD